MSAPQTPSTIQFVQAQAFTLSGSGSSIGDTTLILSSMQDIDGNNIVTADLGSFAFGTLEPGNGVQEEAILFTGVTQNANGTATLTGIQSLLFKQPYTLTSGLIKTHAGASKFILSNDAAFYNNLILYMNAIAGAGAANASTAVKGIVQAATAAQINSSTATGSTGAILVVTPDALGASTNNQYVASIINTGIPYAVATGTATAYTATFATGFSTLASGASLNFLVPISNATGITLNVNSLGAKSLKKNVSTSLASGDLSAGQIVEVVFDGTNFQVATPVPATPTSYNNGVTTHNLATTGTQNIAHGLGKLPKVIRINANANSARSGYTGIAQSFGTYNGSTIATVSNYMEVISSGTSNGVSAASSSDTSNIISLCTDSSVGNYAMASVTFDTTNIILTWSISNSPTGTAQIVWEAIS